MAFSSSFSSLLELIEIGCGGWLGVWCLGRGREGWERETGRWGQGMVAQAKDAARGIGFQGVTERLILPVIEQVKYFKQRRVMEWKKQKAYEKLAAEGAEGMPEGMAIPSGMPTQSSRTSK